MNIKVNGEYQNNLDQDLNTSRIDQDMIGNVLDASFHTYPIVTTSISRPSIKLNISGKNGWHKWNQYQDMNNYYGKIVLGSNSQTSINSITDTLKNNSFVYEVMFRMGQTPICGEQTPDIITGIPNVNQFTLFNQSVGGLVMRNFVDTYDINSNLPGYTDLARNFLGELFFMDWDGYTMDLVIDKDSIPSFRIYRNEPYLSDMFFTSFKGRPHTGVGSGEREPREYIRSIIDKSPSYLYFQCPENLQTRHLNDVIYPGSVHYKGEANSFTWDKKIDFNVIPEYGRILFSTRINETTLYKMNNNVTLKSKKSINVGDLYYVRIFISVVDSFFNGNKFINMSMKIINAETMEEYDTVELSNHAFSVLSNQRKQYVESEPEFLGVMYASNVNDLLQQNFDDEFPGNPGLYNQPQMKPSVGPFDGDITMCRLWTDPIASGVKNLYDYLNPGDAITTKYTDMIPEFKSNFIKCYGEWIINNASSSIKDTSGFGRDSTILGSYEESKIEY